MTTHPTAAFMYEIEFDIIGACRAAYEQWLAENSMEWVTYETVASFEVWHNDKGMSPEAKFVFGFETLEQWASFVNSETHMEAKDALRQVVTGLNANLWERDSIQLTNGSADNALPAQMTDCPDPFSTTEELR